MSYKDLKPPKHILVEGLDKNIVLPKKAKRSDMLNYLFPSATFDESAAITVFENFSSFRNYRYEIK